MIVHFPKLVAKSYGAHAIHGWVQPSFVGEGGKREGGTVYVDVFRDIVSLRESRGPGKFRIDATRGKPRLTTTSFAINHPEVHPLILISECGSDAHYTSGILG